MRVVSIVKRHLLSAMAVGGIDLLYSRTAFEFITFVRHILFSDAAS